MNMKDVFYRKYFSSHFRDACGDLDFEFETYHRYFRSNYLGHMPANKDCRILDVGCGLGHFLYFLEREGYRNYLGIDISEENFELLKGRGFNVRLCNMLDFFHEDLEPFDLIVMNDVIEHLSKEEIMQALEGINKNLADGGIVIIKSSNASNPIMGLSSRYMDFTRDVIFTEESLLQVLTVIGFRDIQIHPHNIYVYYFNPLNYVAKFMSALLCLLFRLLFIMYGRKTTRVFTKNLIAVAKK